MKKLLNIRVRPDVFFFIVLIVFSILYGGYHLLYVERGYEAGDKVHGVSQYETEGLYYNPTEGYREISTWGFCSKALDICTLHCSQQIVDTRGTVWTLEQGDLGSCNITGVHFNSDMVQDP